jgi:selenocysteine-specific elongation factor
VCANGDRFVLRSYSPVTTIGGGTVVDTHPPKHRLHAGAALRQFGELETGKPDDSVAVYLSRATEPLSGGDLVLESGLAPVTVEEGLMELTRSGQAVTLGDRAPLLYISSARYEEIRASIERSLREFHAEKPLADGMAKETLKKKALPSWDARAADIFLDSLLREGALESHGKIISLPGESATVTDEQGRLIDEVIKRIEERPTSPPTLSELAPAMRLDRQMLSDLLTIAEKQERAVRVSPELYFSPGAIEAAEKKLRDSIKPEGITVSEFKTLIGTSRKYALPLLEYFDRAKVTFRAGDVRRLR